MAEPDFSRIGAIAVLAALGVGVGALEAAPKPRTPAASAVAGAAPVAGSTGKTAGVDSLLDQADRALAEAEDRTSAARARKLLEQALSLAPRHPEVWTRLGYLALSEGRLGDAIERFDMVVNQLDPRRWEAWYGLARAYIQEETKAAKARDTMRACRDAGPDVPGNFWMSGNIELATLEPGSEERAVGYYLYAMGIDDAEPKYKGWAIMAHMLAHRYGAAAPIETALRAQDPGNSFLLVAEGIRWELKGDPVPARDSYQRALAADPVNPWAHWCLANVLLGRGNQEFVEAARLNTFLYGPFTKPAAAAGHIAAVQRLAPEFPFRARLHLDLEKSLAYQDGRSDGPFREKVGLLKQHRSRIRSAAPQPAW